MNLSGYITLEEVKKQVEVEQDETAHDQQLETCLGAAERWAVNFCDVDSMHDFVKDRDASPLQIQDDVKMAILMAAAHWFENRESVVIGTIATKVDFSTESLLWPHRRVGV